MANWYVDSVGYTAVAQWAATHTYAVGNIVRQLAAPAAGNERCFRASSITTGISGGSEPAWNLTKGATTTDSGVTWTEVTGNETYQATNAWSAPHARITPAASFMAAGDTMVVGSNHAETQAGVIEPVSPAVAGQICYMICVNPVTAAVPPVSGDLTTGATVTTTSANPIRLDGSWAIQGLSFVSSSILYVNYFGSTGSQQEHVNCTLQGVGINLGQANNQSLILLTNTTLNPGSGSAVINGNCQIIHRNTASALQGTISDYPIQLNGGTWFAEGVDYSAETGQALFNAGTSIFGTAVLKDCKLSSSMVNMLRTSNGASMTVDGVNSDDGTGQYLRARDAFTGQLRTDTTLYRTGGASTGASSYAYKLTTTGNPVWSTPFECPPTLVWNTKTAANVNVTLYGIWNAAALPNNDDVWFDVEYLGTSGNQQGTFKSGTKANSQASNAALTADTSAWGAGVTARQNSHAYVSGNMITVPDNVGRVFFCTTGGTSAGSEPAGYASAVDGGSVTDGGATFRAGVRFSLTVTLTSPQPQNVGWITIYWKGAKHSSTFWLDPKPVLS